MSGLLLAQGAPSPEVLVYARGTPPLKQISDQLCDIRLHNALAFNKTRQAVIDKEFKIHGYVESSVSVLTRALKGNSSRLCSSLEDGTKS